MGETDKFLRGGFFGGVGWKAKINYFNKIQFTTALRFVFFFIHDETLTDTLLPVDPGLGIDPGPIGT